MRDIGDPLAIRTVAIHFPDGETQYWLTDRVFSLGETVERNGRTFVVSDVASSVVTGKEPRVQLEEASPQERGDREALDRKAWNVPAPPAA